MKYIHRELQSEILRAVRHFPAIVLPGPRRAGKTAMLRKMFPKSQYVLLDDPDIIARVSTNPQGFLDEVAMPVILDEVQNVAARTAALDMVVVHQPTTASSATRAIAPGVRAVAWCEFVAKL